MIPSQMLKGTLEGCVLRIISEEAAYGYEITQKLEQYGFGEISEGTIYPLLLRMEKNGWAKSSYRESKAGPRRRYFSLTKTGKAELAGFERNWEEMEKAVNRVLKRGRDYEKQDREMESGK